MVVQGLRVETFLLCKSLDVVNDELYILGGGWGKVGFFAFPGVHSFQIAVRLIVPFTDTNQELQFDVTLEDQDGHNILPGEMQPKLTVGRPVDLVRGEEQAVHFPLFFSNIEIPHSGTYVFRLHHHGKEMARTSFAALAVSPGLQVSGS